MWVGSVDFLFSVTFKNSGGSHFDCDLAFVSCLYDFEHPSAMSPMQQRAGARMFSGYVPSIQWTIVLPVNHILGRVLLMKLYLEGSKQPTIPRSLARDQGFYFEHGCADRAGQDGSGSRLFELNVHLWQYGRPQPRTMSIQQRLVRKAARLASRSQRRRAAKRARQDEGQDGQDGEQEQQDEEQEEQLGLGGYSVPHNHPPPPPLLPARTYCRALP